MSGARACLGDTPRDRASLINRTLAVARLACASTRAPVKSAALVSAFAVARLYARALPRCLVEPFHEFNRRIVP